MPRPRAWNPKRLGCITTHFIILEQLKRLVARLDRWSLIVTVCFSNDQSTEFRAIGTEPRRFSQKGFDSLEPMFKNAPEWIEIGPKETKYYRLVLFLLTSPAFLLDSETPNIAISRSANNYERCPQFNEHPPRLSSLWTVDAQCRFPVSRRSIVSRRSMLRILNFTLKNEARRMNCFDQADHKSQRVRWRRHYYL